MSSLKFLQSSLLSTPHAFFTRQGGTSQGLYASLNFASTKEDSLANLHQNRRLVTDWFGVPSENLLIPHQVHGQEVCYVEEPFPLDPPELRPSVDGLITRNPELILGITTADCVPVLFFDPFTRTISAVHAGWRGTLKGIIPHTLEKLKTLKAKPETLQVAIGPCISQKHFEVGSEVRESFLIVSPWASKLFQPSTRENHFVFDLAGYICHQLHQAGVQTLDLLNQCTYSQPELFYSCRRAAHRGEPTFGTFLSALKLPSVY